MYESPWDYVTTAANIFTGLAAVVGIFLAYRTIRISRETLDESSKADLVLRADQVAIALGNLVRASVELNAQFQPYWKRDSKKPGVAYEIKVHRQVLRLEVESRQLLVHLRAMKACCNAWDADDWCYLEDWVRSFHQCGMVAYQTLVPMHENCSHARGLQIMHDELWKFPPHVRSTLMWGSRERGGEQDVGIGCLETVTDVVQKSVASTLERAHEAANGEELLRSKSSRARVVLPKKFVSKRAIGADWPRSPDQCEGHEVCIIANFANMEWHADDIDGMARLVIPDWSSKLGSEERQNLIVKAASEPRNETEWKQLEEEDEGYLARQRRVAHAAASWTLRHCLKRRGVSIVREGSAPGA